MSLKNKTRLFKWLCYGICFLIFTALQTSVFSRFPLRGAVPMLAPAAAVIVTMLDGTTDAVVFSMIAGIIADGLTGASGFYTLTLCLTSAVIMSLMEKLVARSKMMMFIMSGVVTVTEHVLRAAVTALFAHASSSEALWATTLPELLYTLVITIPMLLIMAHIEQKFTRTSRYRR